MIRGDYISPQAAKRDFEAWFPFWGGKVYVNLVCYADESGTHDKTGNKPGSREGIFGGLIAPREEWAIFCRDWQAALNHYKVPSFHYYEWRDALIVARGDRKPTSKFSKNPYRHLSASTLEET